MANLNTDTKKLANGLASDFSHKIENSNNQLEKMAYDSGEKIGAAASNFATIAMDSVASSRDYVKENPYKGVAIAMATGMVVGSFLSSYRRRSKD